MVMPFLRILCWALIFLIKLRYKISYSRKTSCCQLFCAQLKLDREENLNQFFLMGCIANAVFALFLLLCVLDVGFSLFDLFGSMDDARDALMSFYDPVVIQKPKVTKVTKARFPPRRSHGKYGISIPSFSIVASGAPATPISSKKLATRRSASTNKFIEAIEDIERALADAQQTGRRVTHDAHRLLRLKKLIKAAVQKRSYRFARKAIGEAMFTLGKIKDAKRTGRGKRSAVVSARNFLGDVKRTIGSSGFNDLLAMQGQVTLMFTMDRTGSMREEIATAKRIAQSIVDQKRAEPVDYILSPFSDPAPLSGPVQYFTESEKHLFVRALNSLKAVKGGDCPELTFKGMIDAIEEGQPQPDSPMYVFTDANAKDGTDEKKEGLREIAKAQGIVINFFLSGSCRRDLSAFKDIARETTGQVFRLKDVGELAQLRGVTSVSLGGTAVISNGMENNVVRKKRSSSRVTKTYSFPVDDTVDTLVVSVTTDKPRSAHGWSVSLASPSGAIAGVTPKSLDKGTVYQISKPVVGSWNLAITKDNSVQYDFYAKGSSDENIDFEYYFVKKTRKGSVVPIANPIRGEVARAILTVGGVKKIDRHSLRAELMTLGGKPLPTNRPVSLKPEDKAGYRHSFTFSPPAVLFKIKLTGKTKKGYQFERICHNPIKSETLLISVLYAKNDFTIPWRRSTFVIFVIENFGNSEVAAIRVFMSLGRVERLSRKHVTIRKRRRTSFSVKFLADTRASKSKTITIVATAIGKTSGSKSTVSIPLLVV